jgi:hypothetical protein
VQSSRLQQLVLLVDDASSAWSRRQQKIVRRPPNIVCTAGPSFFAAAIDGIRMANAGSRATAFLVACASDVGLHGAHFSSLWVHERCL